MSEPRDFPLADASDSRVANEWALVLASSNVSSRVQATRGRFVVYVSPEDAERAAALLEVYARENPPREEPRREVSEPPRFSSAGVGLGLALLVFYRISGPRRPVPWFERGSADAAAIIDGETWRTVTALTLHADLGHVLSNALCGALFFGAVCGALGPGVGGLLVLLAGAAGNLANAWFHGDPHDSVGASTAVFAAVGVLSALAVARRWLGRMRGRFALAPVAAGLALLAMLGTTGARVDLWAHLFGLLAGLVLGIPVAWWVRRPPPAGVQWVCAGLAALVLVQSWTTALR